MSVTDGGLVNKTAGGVNKAAGGVDKTAGIKIRNAETVPRATDLQTRKMSSSKSTANANYDTRQELADLVKRRAEIAVS